MKRTGAGVVHATTGTLGRVLRGRPCRGLVTVLFDGCIKPMTVREADLRLVATHYATAKRWQQLTREI